MARVSAGATGGGTLRGDAHGWSALGCCISGQLTGGCRGGFAACAGGQASRTWWATPRRRRSGRRRPTRGWTRIRTAPPAVGNFSCLRRRAGGLGAALDACCAVCACAGPWLTFPCRALRTGGLSFSGTAVMAVRGPAGTGTPGPGREIDIRTMVSLIGEMSSAVGEVERRSAQGLLENHNGSEVLVVNERDSRAAPEQASASNQTTV